MKSTTQTQVLSPSQNTSQDISLLTFLNEIEDGRRAQGIRHPLVSILFGVFAATLAGCSTLAECLEWMSVHYLWLTRHVVFPHGLPDATTISRTVSKVRPTSFTKVISSWWVSAFGLSLDDSASLDGKAIRALSGMNLVNHILNLFTHHTHILLGQMGVTEKTNEIPISPVLLAESDIVGVTVTGDALLTQVKIAQAILEGGGDYFLSVKENQKELYRELCTGFADSWLKRESATFKNYRKTRSMTITIDVSNDFDLDCFGFPKLATVGRITRVGIRTNKGNTANINEATYFITSRDDVTPAVAYQLSRGHWSIENSLHWVKDQIYHEDQQRLSRGYAPEIMAHIRSLCISLVNQIGSDNISQTIRSFMMRSTTHYRFMAIAHLI
jgi:predicted transposase YbfD/YdcC